MAIRLIAAGISHARRLESLELDSVVSVPMLDRKFFSRHDGLSAADPLSARVGLVAFRGTFRVASSHRLVAVVAADIAEHEVVIFDFTGTTYLDDSAAMVVDQLVDAAFDEQTEIIVMGIRGTAANTLQTLQILRRVPSERVVDTLDEAQDVAADILAS